MLSSQVQQRKPRETIGSRALLRDIKREVRVLRLITNTAIEEKILLRANDKLSMESVVIESGKVGAGQMMLKTPLLRSALQHSILGVWSSALDTPWIQLVSRPYPKESVELTETTPTAHFE